MSIVSWNITDLPFHVHCRVEIRNLIVFTVIICFLVNPYNYNAKRHASQPLITNWELFILFEQSLPLMFRNTFFYSQNVTHVCICYLRYRNRAQMQVICIPKWNGPLLKSSVSKCVNKRYVPMIALHCLLPVP